jgi:predicted nuclease with TOPRIM domain
LRSVDVSWSEIGEWCAEAADEIERLRDEVFNLQTEVHFDDQAIKSFQVVNERLREALQKILDLNNFENIFEIASAALKDGE